MTDIDKKQGADTPGISRRYRAMQEYLSERGSGWGDEFATPTEALMFLSMRMGMGDDIAFGDKMNTVRELAEEPSPITAQWRAFAAAVTADGSGSVEVCGYRWLVEFEELTCIDGPGPECSGAVHVHTSASGLTHSARCDGHQKRIWQRQDEINQRYPYYQPPDFDPTYAGEVWGEEDY